MAMPFSVVTTSSIVAKLWECLYAGIVCEVVVTAVG